jgi:hypothetical protein
MAQTTSRIAAERVDLAHVECLNFRILDGFS